MIFFLNKIVTAQKENQQIAQIKHFQEGIILIYLLPTSTSISWEADEKGTRFDVYETLCPQQMLVHKGGQIKNWSGEYRDIIPTKLQCQAIQRALQSPSLQREIIRKK